SPKPAWNGPIIGVSAAEFSKNTEVLIPSSRANARLHRFSFSSTKRASRVGFRCVLVSFGLSELNSFFVLWPLHSFGTNILGGCCRYEELLRRSTCIERDLVQCDCCSWTRRSHGKARNHSQNHP